MIVPAYQMLRDLWRWNTALYLSRNTTAVRIVNKEVQLVCHGCLGKKQWFVVIALQTSVSCVCESRFRLSIVVCWLSHCTHFLHGTDTAIHTNPQLKYSVFQNKSISLTTTHPSRSIFHTTMRLLIAITSTVMLRLVFLCPTFLILRTQAGRCVFNLCDGLQLEVIQLCSTLTSLVVWRFRR